MIYQESTDTFPGQVLAQSPTGGSALDRGSVVTITVAQAPPEPTLEPVPTFEPVPSEPAAPVASDGPPQVGQ